MAGIYIHIPFCKQACHYCNFHFATSLQYKEALIKALQSELELQQDYLDREEINTIYLGGGTPSLCTIRELADILDKVMSVYRVQKDAEITLETNPDDITVPQLEEWKSAGINRLSIGIQSFFDEDLLWMNRAHNANQASESLEQAIHIFENISVDLIYGVPGLSDEKWEKNVRSVTDMNIPHLSCYALTVEPKTPLEKLIRLKQFVPTEPEQQSRQFLQLMDWLDASGYEQYEISNFALPGRRSLHNSSYWMGKKYLGIGPSAHSFNGISRQWNIANNQRYIEAIKQGKVPYEREELDETQKMNEYIMTSLRTMEGTDLRIAGSHLLEKGDKHIRRGLLAVKGHALLLTKEGKLFADGITAELFH